MSFAMEASNQVLRTHEISTMMVKTWKQNSGMRFVASGILGNLVFFSLDNLLLLIILQWSDTGRPATASAATKWIRRHAESVSFFVAYMLDIIVQRKSFSISLFVS
eukprot:CCRYP_008357-RA/>CCRYP_008357-RA protein AED:0.19 eAED:0.19 QI:159/1/1/1/0/0/2/313/105